MFLELSRRVDIPLFVETTGTCGASPETFRTQSVTRSLKNCIIVKLTGTKHGEGLVEGMVEFFAARREAGGLKLFSTFRWVPPACLLIGSLAALLLVHCPYSSFQY